MTTEGFLLERYKYILEQKRSLNTVTFKIVSIFQLVVAAVASANFTIVKSVQGAEIDVSFAKLAIIASYIAFLISTIACILLLLGGLASWLSYRRDEADVEIKVHGAAREGPKLQSLFRWYETYVSLTLFAAIVGYSLALPTLLDRCYVIKPVQGTKISKPH